MCFTCDTGGGGYCFCGTSKDPQGSLDPCDVKRGYDTCSRCGHRAGRPDEMPAYTDGDAYEYE